MEVLGHLTPKNVFTTITAPFNIYLFVRKPQVAVPRCTICVYRCVSTKLPPNQIENDLPLSLAAILLLNKEIHWEKILKLVARNEYCIQIS